MANKKEGPEIEEKGSKIEIPKQDPKSKKMEFNFSNVVFLPKPKKKK